MSTIVGENDKFKNEMKFQTDRVTHLAKRFIENTRCRTCGNKDRKAVNLHEFGDPHLPSQVNIYCSKCHRSDVFALRPSDESMAFAKMELGKGETILPGKPVDTAEEMIEYAKHFLRGELKAKEEADKAIKDEDSKIIASPEQIKKYEKEHKKK